MHMSNLLRYTVIRLLFSIVGTITLYVIIFCMIILRKTLNINTNQYEIFCYSAML